MNPGTIIDDKFEVIGLLGSGGFGNVYACMHPQLGRKVAVKILNTTLIHEPEGRARFEREARAISAITHRNIVGFHGYGVWQQAPYMVMELIEGKSSDRLLAEEGKVDPRRALNTMRQVLDALSCAHKAGVIHRDLKPSNIMLAKEDDKEVVKLIDFGLAKLMPGYGIPGQKLTDTGYTVGTCHYIPPEQALGGDIDGRADVYSVGCILYHYLAGRPPFDGQDNVEVMAKHLQDIAPPITDYIAAPHGDAIAIFIDNCIAKDPADRYQSAADALRDLDAILRGAPKTVVPLATKPKCPVHAKPRLPMKAIAISAALTICAAGIYAGWCIKKNAEISEQLESDVAVIERAIRRWYKNELKASELQAIKKRDDAYHRLNPRERFFVLVETGRKQLRDHQKAAALASAKEAEPLLDQIGVERSYPVTLLATLLWDCGDRTAGDQVLIHMTKWRDSGQRWEARQELIDSYVWQNRLPEAEKLARENLAEERSIFTSTTKSELSLGYILFLQDRFDEAKPLFEAVAWEHEEEQGCIGLALIALAKQNFKEALKQAEEADGLAHRHQSDLPGPYTPAMGIAIEAYKGLHQTKLAAQREALYGKETRVSGLLLSAMNWDRINPVIQKAQQKK